jgi:hypothetical protein
VTRLWESEALGAKANSRRKRALSSSPFKELNLTLVSLGAPE